MRKTLLATSALIAAGLVASPALAGKAELNFSGGAKFEMSFVGDENDSGATDGSGVDISNAAGSTQIHFDAKGSNEDGSLEFGYRMDMRAATSDGGSNSTDESYMWFKGNWGRLVVGRDDNVVDAQVVTGADVLAAASGFDGSFGIRGNHIGGASKAPDLATSEGDKGKLAYYSPEFSGFQFAASWAPSAEGTNGDPNLTSADAKNVIGLAAKYEGNIGEVGLNAGVGYIFGDEALASTGTEAKEHKGLQAGVNVSFADFKVGVGYTTDYDSFVGVASTQDQGDVWDFGVAYGIDKYNFSLGYIVSEEDDGANGVDEFQAVVLGVDYALAEGLTAYGEVQWAESKDDTAQANADNYESTALVLGTKISF